MPQTTNTTSPDWLPTGQAAQQLGVSACTLKRYAKRDGILEEGTHFRHGVHANSPKVWHVKRCFQALSRGIQR